jgi:BioD-like phosphotransacetylase family protein
MSATIRFRGADGSTIDAVFNGLRWSCSGSRAKTEEELNAFERRRIRNSPLYEPNRIQAAAEAAAKHYNGTVVEPHPPEEAMEGTIY